jgi:hypothetical protein
VLNSQNCRSNGVEPALRTRYQAAMNLRAVLPLVVSCAALVAALVVAPGCEKSGSGAGGGEPAAGKASGKPTAEEAAMLASLPGGNLALFGGNYMQFQKYMQESPLARMVGALEQQGVPGMTEWMTCFVEGKQLVMLGGVKLEGTRVDMRFLMKGMTLAEIAACAARAGFPATIDEDGKFLALDMPNPLGTMRSGYLVVAGGALYTRQTMPFPEPQLVPVDRPALEAEVAQLARGTAANDTALVRQLAQLDRSRAVWFVATAADTPLASKLGLVHGTFDIEDGLHIDVTAQVLDKAIANQIADGIPKVKQQAGQLGPAVKSVIEGLQFSRKGDRLRFALAVDNAQLAAMMDALGPMMGAGLGGSPY